MTIESHIRNLIFDLGGVIINIDFDLTMNALKRFASDQKLGTGAYLDKAPFFYQYETGKIDDLTFLESMKEHYQLDASIEQIREAWNALLLDIPKARIEVLQKLRQQYKLFLLSNTNPIHFVDVEKILQKDTGQRSLYDLFDKVYLSYELGAAKPEPNIYEAVLKDAGIKAQETIFFDDSIANIQAAETVGIQTVHISPDNDIRDLFVNI